MTKGSDNDFPSILLTEQGSAPASPAASHQRLYIRTSDHTLVTVNSSGTVTPVDSSGSTASGCKAYRTTTLALSATTMTAIGFASEETDTDGYHDNVTNNTRITVPTGKAGKFIVEGYWYGITNGTNNVSIAQLYKNGTTPLRSQTTFLTPTNASGVGIYVSAGFVALADADYVELRAWNSAAITVGDAANNEQQPFLSVTRIGT